MNIEENKLIAEFMEFKLDKFYTASDWYDLPEEMQTVYARDCASPSQSLPPKRMLFESNWSWIMPVVDKIRKMNYTVESNINPMGADRFIISSGGAIVVKIHSGHIQTATYRGVVEFIKHYNK